MKPLTRKEKGYYVLFALLMGIYAYIWLGPSKDLWKPEPSSAVEEFRAAEASLHERFMDPKAIQEYFSSRPFQQALFNFLTLVLTTFFFFGIILDLLYLVNPGRRREFSSALDPPQTSWKLFMLFKVIVLFMGGSILASLGLGTVRHFFFPQMSLNFHMLMHTTMADILCIFFVFWIVREEGGDWRDLGFRIPDGKIFKEMAAGWIAYAGILPVFMAALIVLMLLAQKFHYEPPPHPLVHVFIEEEKRAPELIYYSVFLAIVLGPVFEEIFFRGFCYSIFKKRFGALVAMVLSAAFFGAIHANTFAFWPIFILGLGLAYIYEKRKNLLSPIILHVTHNAIFIAYFFLAKSFVSHASPGA